MATATKTKAKKSAKRIANAKKNTRELEDVIDQQVALFRTGMEKGGLTADELAGELKISPARVRQLLDGRAMSMRAVVETLAAMNLRLVLTTRPLRS